MYYAKMDKDANVKEERYMHVEEQVSSRLEVKDQIWDVSYKNVKFDNLQNAPRKCSRNSKYIEQLIRLSWAYSRIHQRY